MYSLEGREGGFEGGDDGDAAAYARATGALSWRLTQLELFHERRLGGAAGAEAEAALDGFGTEARLGEDDFVAGMWEACAGAALQLLPSTAPAGSGAGAGARRAARVLPIPFWGMDPKPMWSCAARAPLVPCQLLRLPLGCWAYVEQSNPGLLVVESGRLLPTGERQVAALSYTAGALDSATLGRDAPLAVAEAAAKGYLQSDDPAEQAYYNSLLAEMEMDSDLGRRDALSDDATLYSDMGDDETAEGWEGDEEEERLVRGPRPSRGV